MVKENLRRYMAEAGLSPESLAAKLQAAQHPASCATVIAWMNGYRTPNLGNAKALANVLNITVDELIAPPKVAV